MKITGIIMFVFLVSAISLMFMKNNRLPVNLGIHDGKLSPLPSSPNGISSQTDAVGKKVKPFPFKGNLDETRVAIRHMLAAYGNMQILKEGSTYIHAVNRTRIMGFKDDLEFYFDELTAQVHIRTSSRIGYSDLGLNRKRYEQLSQIYLHGVVLVK